MDLTKENYTNNKVSDDRMAIAIDLMQEGYMCSESVVMAYAEKFGLERELAARITGGFAGGMAQGKTCGALSGAVMVLGLKYGMGVVRNQYAKDLCFQMTQELFHRFETRCRTTLTIERRSDAIVPAPDTVGGIRHSSAGRDAGMVGSESL